MKNIKFTYVDSITEISVAKEPSKHGPQFPKIKGLQYSFARESLYPTQVPEFIGTCDDDADLTIDGFLQELTEEQLELERAAETVYQAARMRVERTSRLYACDWTQLNDSPVDMQAWAAYRQELRDITSQAGFPWEIQWPTKPEENWSTA
jgi:hypothetical protein